MGVAAKDDGVQRSEECAHPAALLRLGVIPAAEEEPEVIIFVVVGEYRSVDKHKDVARPPGLLQQAVDLLYLGAAVAYHYIGVRAHMEKEIGTCHFLPELLRHTGRYVLVIGLDADRVVVATEVVVTRHGDKREIRRELQLEIIHRVGEETFVGLRIRGVALDEVSDLIDKPRVLVHEAGGPPHEILAAPRPHYSVARKLLAVSSFAHRIGVCVAGVVEFGIGRVVVGVPKNDDGILSARDAPEVSSGRHRRQPSHRQGQPRQPHRRYFKETSPVHRYIPSIKNFLSDRCVIPFSFLRVKSGVALMTYFG